MNCLGASNAAVTENSLKKRKYHLEVRIATLNTEQQGINDLNNHW